MEPVFPSYADSRSRNAHMTHRPGQDRWRPRRPEPGGSVRVLPAVVLEDESDRREQDEQHPDQEKPPAHRHTDRRDRRRQPGDQRPPAVRAEEAELPRAVTDLCIGDVLRPGRQPTAGEQEVEAGEKGEADGQEQRRGPGRVLGEVPVDDVNDAEEHGAADEQEPFDLHETPLSGRLIAGPWSPRMPGLTVAPRWIRGRAGAAPT